jgi:hypothetical protein
MRGSGWPAITEVLIKDNGVVVIAGIYTIEKSDGTEGIPLFSKIPLLGYLFKREAKEDKRKDKNSSESRINYCRTSGSNISFKAERGDFDQMTPAQRTYVQGIRDYLERWRTFGNTVGEKTEGITPLSIEKLSSEKGEVYMPHRLKSTADILNTAENIISKPTERNTINYW